LGRFGRLTLSRGAFFQRMTLKKCTLWATWCPPGGPELQVLESLHRELGVQHLAIVAVDASGSMPVVREYAGAQGLRSRSSLTRAATSSAHTVSWVCPPRS
jgi:hypothetical protein